jgi:histidinol phosphatase-like PHP family hydrolase
MVRLFDCHAHTADLSYCCQAGIGPEHYVEACARHPELCGIAITNHGFAAYFPAELAWSARFIREPRLFDEYREWGNARIRRHLDAVEPLRAQGVFTGLEVELMDDDRLTVDPAFRPRLDVIIGSVHFLPDLPDGQIAALPPQQVLDHWWEHNRRLAAAGIDILGHPFRWLNRVGRQPLEQAVIDGVVALARQHGIALEINAHAVIPGDTRLLRACVDAGVAVAFGSDAHSHAELGCLDYHRDLVRAAGLRLEDIPLWLPKRLRPGAG